ncbi:hypothetical protein JG688_00014332, partial [Phytophthora aleatoria]
CAPTRHGRCWDKYRKFYPPNNLFAIKGNIPTGSKLVAKCSSPPITSVAALERPPTARRIELQATLSSDVMIVAKSRISDRERNDQSGAERGGLEGREAPARSCEVASVSETAVVELETSQLTQYARRSDGRRPTSC